MDVLFAVAELGAPRLSPLLSKDLHQEVVFFPELGLAEDANSCVGVCVGGELYCLVLLESNRISLIGTVLSEAVA
jgi:hypothetical protein